MDQMQFNQAVDSLFDGMGNVFSSKTVVGEPTKIDDTIIVPLVDVTFGMGAGAGNNDKKNSAGGGMGGKISPTAVLVIQNGHARLVNVKNQDAITKVLDMVPDMVDRFFPGKGKVTDEEAKDIAFPEE